jgi:hypothetical protein
VPSDVLTNLWHTRAHYVETLAKRLIRLWDGCHSQYKIALVHPITCIFHSEASGRCGGSALGWGLALIDQLMTPHVNTIQTAPAYCAKSLCNRRRSGSTLPPWALSSSKCDSSVAPLAKGVSDRRLLAQR